MSTKADMFQAVGVLVAGGSLLAFGVCILVYAWLACRRRRKSWEEFQARREAQERSAEYGHIQPSVPWPKK